MPQRDCPLCGEVLEDAPAVHDLAKCEKTELEKGRVTIKKLRASLHEWKYGEGAWFELREIIGWLWWHHPAIDNDAERAHYQNNLRALEKVRCPSCYNKLCFRVETDAACPACAAKRNHGETTASFSSPSDSGDQVGQVQSHDGNDSPGRHGEGESSPSEDPPGQPGDPPNP